MLPNLRSLPGAIIVIALVLYPYVYLSARTMFQFQSAEFAEAAKTLSAGRWTAFWRISLPMARPALAVGVSAGVAGDAERHRRQRISRRPHTHGVGVHDLAQPRQPCRRRAAVLLHAGDRGRTYRHRALRPPQCHDGIFRRKPAAHAADDAYRHQGRFGLRSLPAAGAVWDSLVPLLYLAHQSFKRGLFANFDMALWRDAFNSVAFASLATLAALLLGFATILAWRWRPDTLRFVAMNIAQTGLHAAGAGAGARACWRRCSPSTTRLNALAGWLGRSPPGLILIGSGCRRRHRLCDPLSGGADRLHQGRVRADSARLRRQRARGLAPARPRRCG